MSSPLPPKVLGNKSIQKFDYVIIGSGAAGSSAASILCRHGKKVLIIEAGPNYFFDLDDKTSTGTSNLFGQDFLKFGVRNFITPDTLAYPQSHRRDEKTDRTFVGDVMNLANLVGGTFAHAGAKTPRFQPADFRMKSLLPDIPGANFADWPISYEDLEPFYTHIEYELGVQGETDPAKQDPFAGPRSKPFPMDPGMAIYSSKMLADAAGTLGYHPYAAPMAIPSRPYRGRPACVNCGTCSNHGCAWGDKGIPAYTTLRDALLTGNCLLVAETRVMELKSNSAKNKIESVECLDPQGKPVSYKADQYILAASPISNTKLLLQSDKGGKGLGNSSDMVGRNVTFHADSYVIAIFEQRLHGYRGRDFSHGMSDFRGMPANPYGDKVKNPVGGMVVFESTMFLLDEARIYAKDLGLNAEMLRGAMGSSPFRDRFIISKMIGEDAPQFKNRVDLDPALKDMNGQPAARITYDRHKFELSAREHYMPKIMEINKKAGAKQGFVAPQAEVIEETRHIAGTLRFGADPKTTVCRPDGRFHDIGNLYCVDGSLFPTISGFNPTLTIMATAALMAAKMVTPQTPTKALEKYKYEGSEKV